MCELGHYFAGLIDGEGSFSLVIYKEKVRDKIRWRFSPRFKIKLKDDDYAILLRLKEELKCGELYRNKELTKKKSYINCAVYSVSSIKACKERITPYFEEHPLRALKAKTFVVWKEAIDIIYKKPYTKHSKDDLIRLCELREQMNVGRWVHNRVPIDIVKQRILGE